MFEKLQRKWKLSAGKVLLMLLIFALGGSLTGYAGRKILPLLHIDNLLLYIVVYILVITIIWPAAVLLVSIPFGQFSFFRKYIARMGNNLFGKKSEVRNQKSGIRIAPSSQKHLVIFASGAGSNAEKIINYFENSELAKVSLIVCNKPGAGVLTLAKQYDIPVLLIEKERFFRGDAYLPELRSCGADLLVLAGFLWKIPHALIDAYPRRIVNIHPALLPKYGGRGMYGQYVHEAILTAGEVESGITIHYVDEHYDNGDIIFQTACPVIAGDTAETLAARIHQLEHLHFPPVIEEVLRKL